MNCTLLCIIFSRINKHIQIKSNDDDSDDDSSSSNSSSSSTSSSSSSSDGSGGGGGHHPDDILAFCQAIMWLLQTAILQHQLYHHVVGISKHFFIQGKCCGKSTCNVYIQTYVCP